jgi:hypothetical protein
VITSETTSYPNKNEMATGQMEMGFKLTPDTGLSYYAAP